MGVLLNHQESHVYMRDFKGCKWAPLFHFFDFHRKFNIRKLLSDKKHFDKTILFSGNKLKGSSYLPLTSQPFDSMDHQKHKTGKSNSGKSKSILRSFIPRKFYRKQGQKQKILPLSPKLLRTISIHHLESNDYVNTGTGNTGSSVVKNDSSKSESIYRLPKYPHASIQEIDVKKSFSLPSEIRHKWKSPSTDLDASQIKPTDSNLTQNDSKDQIEKNLKRIISMDGILHKIPYGQKPTENPKNSKDLSFFRSVSVNYEREGPRRLMRRSHSLSESVDRYANLFDSLSLSRESASKNVRSDTKLTKDYGSFKECKDGMNPIEVIHDSNASVTVQEEIRDSNASITMQEEIRDSNASITMQEEILDSNASITVQEEIHDSNASETVQEEIRDSNASETVQEENRDSNASITLQDEIHDSNASETVQEEIHDSNASETVQSASETVREEIQRVSRENESLEMSERSEDFDLDFKREKEEIMSVEKIKEGPFANEIEKESPVSVLDLDFQNLEEIGVSFNVISPREISQNTPLNLESLPSPNKDLNLENLRDLFENFGFRNEDFLEIFDSILQQVQLEMNDFSKFDDNFATYDYDENMSLDENLLYALTHESLLEIFAKYFSNGKITNYISVPLEKVLFKDLWRKMNWFVNSKDHLDGGNNLTSDGWLDLSREREIVGVELGNIIFEGLLDELFF
ncbi:hypothetical protein LUZ60_009157 [Juncus effusus]|nr:hypothetical protein LUZ60_009157 [Juncus effusus]